ncbi:uncharacterized protein LY89DRAFT_192465 [Mollisia scopiformis]|uniref:Uncharacterized protein n=1 Tax=Mollisia scopiformis TaxID=149040 RepID=A0A194WYK7_MOLSC|nr:uncharacterized protein LY89DRAFT_192465 [Mollisia scopiformis]KUJ12769.1 hypothetical protein LY89DRAFT_192465 [Mollisia scopiformis]
MNAFRLTQKRSRLHSVTVTPFTRSKSRTRLKNCNAKRHLFSLSPPAPPHNSFSGHQLRKRQRPINLY